MKILVIEDDDIKFNLVEEVLLSSGNEVILKRAASYQSGIAVLLSNEFDCVVLDMTLPVYDHVHTVVGAEQLTFGGELILREITRKKVRARFIVLSQYDTFLRNGIEVTFGQLRLELMQKYAPSVVGCVRLDNSSVEWKNQILSLIHAS